MALDAQGGAARADPVVLDLDGEPLWGRGSSLVRVIAGLLLLAIISGVLLVLNPAWVALAVGSATLIAALAMRRPGVLIAFFAFVEPFQALCLHFLSPEARYFDELFMIVLCATILGSRFVRAPGAFMSDPFVRLVGVFVALGLLSSCVNGLELAQAFAGLFVTLDYLLLFLALRCLPLDVRDARVLMWSLIVPGIAAAIVGALQMVSPHEYMFSWQVPLVESGVARPPSLFEHPNDFGFYLLQSMFLVFGALIHLSRPKMTFVILLVLLAGIGVSMSRTSYAVAVLSFLLVVLGRGRRGFVRLAPLVVVLALSTGNIVVSAISSRIEKVRNEGGDARLTYARLSLQVFADHLLLGVGPGRFGGEVAHRYDTELYQRYGLSFDESWTTVDSFWVHLIAEGGALGAMTFIALLIMLAVAARRAHARDPAPKPVVRALLEAVPLMVAGYSVLACTSMAFEANTTAGLFWLVSGVALSAGGEGIGKPSYTDVH